MPQPGRRYLRFLLGGIVLGTVVAFTLNSLVDPWRVLGFPWKLDHLDPWRDIARQTRTGKAGLVRSHPDLELALLGSSRMAISMRADDPAWGGRKALNLGVPSGMLEENCAILENTLDHAPHLEWVVLNLDFGDLTSEVDSRPLADFHQSPFEAGGSLEKSLRYLLGASSLEASVETLKHAARDETPDFDPLGNWSGWHMSEPRNLAAKALPNHHVNAARRFSDLRGELRPRKLDTLRSTLDRCLGRGIRVTLVTIPTHVVCWGWFGVDPPPGRFQETEYRVLAGLVDELRERHPQADIEWWDFHQFHPLTTEAFPGSPPGAQLTWWRDHEHPSPPFGAIIAARIAETEPPAHPGGPIGRRITGATLDDHLRSVAADQLRYLRDHPEQVAWVRRAAGIPTRGTRDPIAE